MYRTEEAWIEAYEEKRALFIHPQDQYHAPHVLLSSGKHSSGFFNSRPIIADDELLKEAASDLVEKFFLAEGGHFRLRLVAGPQTGATKLAVLISRHLNCFGYRTSSVSPAKALRDNKKAMVFSENDQYIVRGSQTLLCDDVCTTGDSAELVAQEILASGGTVLPYVLVLVNRSGEKVLHGRKVISLIDRHLPTWEANDCPLCKMGSEAFPAKDNWDKLTNY